MISLRSLARFRHVVLVTTAQFSPYLGNRESTILMASVWKENRAFRLIFVEFCYVAVNYVVGWIRNFAIRNFAKFRTKN
jgi:hypothetical protein